jgi:hypothetical protein
VAPGPDLGLAALGRQAEDLAGEGAPVRRGLRIARVAGGDVEHPVGPERDPAAVVEGRGGDAVEQHLLGSEGEVVGEREARDAVPAGGRVVDVGETLMHGEAEQPALAGRLHVDRRGRPLAQAAVLDHTHAAGTLGDEHRRLVDEGDLPGDLEARDLEPGRLRRLRGRRLGGRGLVVAPAACDEEEGERE